MLPKYGCEVHNSIAGMIHACLRSMEDKIKSALSARPNIANFDALIERLKSKFEAQLGVPIRLDRDMNYNASNSLEIYLDRDGRLVPGDSTQSSRMAVIVVSSLGKFYTVLARSQTKPRVWEASPIEDVSSLIDKISGILEDEELENLEGNVLDEMAPGHRTQLDNAPATVFQVLFGEIV